MNQYRAQQYTVDRMQWSFDTPTDIIARLAPDVRRQLEETLQRELERHFDNFLANSGYQDYGVVEE